MAMVAIAQGWPFAAAVSAKNSASVSATASAHVIQPLKVKPLKDLSFGKIASGHHFGTVIVTVYNTRNATGGAQLLHYGTFHRASFRVTGTEGVKYSVNLPTNLTSQKTNSTPIPGVTLLNVVDLKSYSVNAGAETLIGEIGSNGTDTLYVGGTLEVPKKASSGLYRGDIHITVEFN